MIRFYLDEMFSSVIAALSRAVGIVAVSALDIHPQSTPDEVHLLFAAREHPDGLPSYAVVWLKPASDRA